tara:strand:+ start:79 stop:384 length:306 start_codon:yes stop_codon:yes gene_type:complete
MAKKLSEDLISRIKLAAAQLNGRIPYKKQEEIDKIELIPEVCIKGTGYLFCYQPDSKSFVKIDRGQKALIMEERKDTYLVYTFDGFLIEIDKDEVLSTGFD